jgi:hypothetical protein
MSRLWSENKGSDAAVVFVQNDVSLFAAANQLVNPFELRFELDTPFVYNPKLGSLAMMLVTEESSGRTRTLDANGYGFLNSSVPVASFMPGNLSPAAIGIIAEFTWVAVPEPKTSLLVFGGAAVLGIGARRRRSSKC